MGKYNISFFDLEKGVSSATIARYGITLNSTSTKHIDKWKYAKLGYDKNRRFIIIQPHNREDEAAGSLIISDKITKDGNYLRINNKDFVRTVAQYCNISLTPSSRYIVEWDADEELLIIDLTKILETAKAKGKD